MMDVDKYLVKVLGTMVEDLESGDLSDYSMNDTVYVFNWTNGVEGGLSGKVVIEVRTDEEAVEEAFHMMNSDVYSATGNDAKYAWSNRSTRAGKFFAEADYYLAKYTLHDLVEEMITLTDQPCVTLWTKEDGIARIKADADDDE